MLRNKLSVASFQLSVKAKTLLILFCACALHLMPCILRAQDDFVYDPKGERDPFIPLVTADGRLLKVGQKEQAKGVSLEGIIFDKEGGSFAIINGDVVKIGDQSEDYQVLKIESDRVILIKNGEPIEIELDKEE